MRKSTGGPSLFDQATKRWFTIELRALLSNFPIYLRSTAHLTLIVFDKPPFSGNLCQSKTKFDNHIFLKLS